MILYPHQQRVVDDAREAFKDHKHICVQSPTGSGKTVIFTSMVGSILKNDFRSWIMVPRNELLEQASEHLYQAGIPHGRISATGQESSAFKVHVVSKDTLIRRYDKIKSHPDIMFPDECHIALDRQIEISKKFPDTRMIGFTATAERTDGRGLNELYGTLVPGAPIAELIELGYLSNPRYYAPKIKCLENLSRKGTDVDSKQLEDLFEKRRVYGDSIRHYQRLADGKPTIIFTRSVKAAEEAAHRFSAAGYRFESIDGSMSKKEKTRRLNGLRNGDLHGLCSNELLTYGVDVKNVECIIMLRPTMSRALFFQMVGRGLRVMEGKQSCVIIDHVNNLERHGHPADPVTWNFTGKEKRIAEIDETIKYRLCPDTFLYCTKPRCADCGNNKTGRRSREEELINCELKEVKPGVEFKHRNEEEKQIFQQKINQAISGGKIEELLNIADALSNPPMWAYWKMSPDRLSVNIPLLHEIRRIKGYKSGWVWFQKKEIEKRLGR